MQPLKSLNLPPLLLKVVVARSRDPLPGRIELRDHSSLNNINFGRSMHSFNADWHSPRNIHSKCSRCTAVIYALHDRPRSIFCYDRWVNNPGADRWRRREATAIAAADSS